MFPTKLWKWHDGAIGQWRVERDCESTTAQAWLDLYRKDNPQALYLIATRRPKAPAWNSEERRWQLL